MNRGSGAGQVSARWGNSGVLGTLGAVGTYLGTVVKEVPHASCRDDLNSPGHPWVILIMPFALQQQTNQHLQIVF